MIPGNIGPSPEDLDRVKRWNQWRNEVFLEVEKTLGSAGSKGAMRFYGDFQVNCDATDIAGIAKLWVTTNPNGPLPQIGYESLCKWENTEPSVAAASILEMCERIKRDPRYVIAKRSV